MDRGFGQEKKIFLGTIYFAFLKKMLHLLYQKGNPLITTRCWRIKLFYVQKCQT